MSGNSAKSPNVNNSISIPETTLFGEIPLSDSDNNSNEISSLRNEEVDTLNDLNQNFINAKNNLNSVKNIDNGITGLPAFSNRAIDTVAVINIDGDGK